ncbi:MAG: hypothetical protein AMK73_03560 [Planctomycetes bacterium SM23_32]|nr:MAG: hypothetical protein AMK73_03560 [Planctomycetes bacterium SM23_32]
MRDHDHERGEAEAPEAAQPEEAAAPEEPTAEQAGTEALARALKGSFRVLKWGMIVLLAVYLGKGVFYVQPQEVRFKLRFGRVVTSWGEKVLKPGTIHIQWPWEEVQTVSTAEQVLEAGEEFYTDWRKAVLSKKQSLDVREDGYLLTGDANIVHMRLNVRYRARGDAEGAQSYLFAVGKENVEEILRRLLLSATTKVVSSMQVMDVLKREGLFSAITDELAERLADFERQAGAPLGIELIAVEAIEGEKEKNPTEPYAVRDAFYEAQNAGSRKDQLVEEGKLQANALLQDARGKASEAVAGAQGYRDRLVNMAQADAEALQKLLPVYGRSAAEADILRDTFYQRIVTDALRKAQGVFVLYQTPQGAQRELRLILGSKPRPPKVVTPETPPAP